jgi:hypothetical protein
MIEDDALALAKSVSGQFKPAAELVMLAAIALSLKRLVEAIEKPPPALKLAADDVAEISRR